MNGSTHPRPRLLVLAGLFAAAILPAAAAAGQAQPTPTFRSAADVVQVDLTVLDRQRRPVRDLDPSEVVVLEDGKPRPIVAFTRVDTAQYAPAPGAPPAVPRSPSPAAAVAPTSSAPAGPAIDSAAAGRLVTILFDRSIPAGPATVTARQIALAVVRSLGPRDEAAVLRSSRFTGDGLTRAFTGDRPRLERAVLSTFSGQVALGEMTRSEGDSLGGLDDGRPEQQFTGDCTCGICTLEAIARVAATVRDVRDRRKVLVWIGSDLLVESNGVECHSRLRDERAKLYRALDLANLTVHVVDPSGLQTRQLEAGSTMRATRAAARQAENRTDDLDRQAHLPVLPDRTGGRTIMNTNAPADLVPAVLDESGAFYLLAFAPADGAKAGRFHKIEVKVSRKGVSVQARRGYLSGPSR